MLSVERGLGRPHPASRSVAPKRQIIGGLASVLLHGGLVWWAIGHEPTRSEPEPAPAELAIVEITSITGEPLAMKASAGSQGEVAPNPEPLRGEAARAVPNPEPVVQTPPLPSRPRAVPPRPRAPTTPAVDTNAEAAPREPDDADAEPSTAPSAGDGMAPARTAGSSRDRGLAGGGDGRMGTDGTPDHSAYGAELVRLVKAEIDDDPVPGLGSRDSIEVVLEVLPSGRLAHQGLGKYDYAQVVRSTLGPLRMRAILRRILRASQEFPPHPSSFPRQRYVVGIRVDFRELRG
jgi:hypothetical protein